MNSGVFSEGASRGGYKPLPPEKGYTTVHKYAINRTSNLFLLKNYY